MNLARDLPMPPATNTGTMSSIKLHTSCAIKRLFEAHNTRNKLCMLSPNAKERVWRQLGDDRTNKYIAINRLLDQNTYEYSKLRGFYKLPPS